MRRQFVDRLVNGWACRHERWRPRSAGCDWLGEPAKGAGSAN
jgi:hypothetical protein